MPWYNTDWWYRKKITVDHDEVATAVTDFPVLVSVTDADLKDTPNGGHMGNSDGTDMLFTEDDGETKLSHEIQRYDEETGQIIVWVKMDLSSAVDTEFYIYYGNAGAADQQNVNDVWSNNFVAVWHLNESYAGDGTYDVIDSTGNGNTMAGLGGGPTRVDGVIGYGQQLDGNNDRFHLPSTTWSNPLTLSVWLTTEGSWDNLYPTLWAHQDASDDQIRIRTRHNIEGNKFWIVVREGGVGYPLSIGLTPMNSELYISAHFDNNRYDIYKNGSYWDHTASIPFSITAATGLGGSGGAGDFLNGIIEEARIASVDRSAGWVLTEYNNQSAPDTFMSFDAEEEGDHPDPDEGSSLLLLGV